MTNSRPARGFATLTVTLLVVVFVTALSLMSGKMLVAEQRVAANEMRYREAMAAAQGGLDAALAQLETNRAWRTTVSSAGSTAYSASFGADTQVSAGSATLTVVNITSVGSSADGQGSATVRQQAVITSVVASTPDAPLTLAPATEVTGNFTVVANPNGGGPGVPLSVWADNDVEIDGSGQTCGQQEYAFGTCDSSPYSSSGNQGADIVDTGPFPSDLFNYVFGVPNSTAGMAVLEGKAKAILNSCSGLDDTTTGFYIVDGDCDSNKAQIGKEASPVLLLIRNGVIKFTGVTKIFGLIFSYGSYPADGTAYDLSLAGTVVLNGALIVNHPVVGGELKVNGTFDTVFNASALQQIQTGPQFTVVSRVPGSWRDW